MISQRFRAVFVVFTVLSAVALVCGPAAKQAQAAFASCATCHPVSFPLATGQMSYHGTGNPTLPETACFNCHSSLPHNGPASPMYPAYYWIRPLEPYQEPNPSINKQQCSATTCHPNLSGTHPHDHIPFLPLDNPARAIVPPTSVLPLFKRDGYPDQSPTVGGLVCSTCHDPHDPSYQIQTSDQSWKYSFLRVGRQSDQLNLCLTCHLEGPQTFGYDLWIDRKTTSLTMIADPLPTAPENHEVAVKITNRGNMSSPSTSMYVTVQDPFGIVRWTNTVAVPPLNPDAAVTVYFDWNAAGLSGDATFILSLPPSPLNDNWVNHQFVKTFKRIPAPQNVAAAGSMGTVMLSWTMPVYNGPLAYNVYRNRHKLNAVPIYGTSYPDYDLPPGTPYTYNVEAVDTVTGLASPMSAMVSAVTSLGTVINVPEQYPTISAAIAAAGLGTTILVAPGTYAENLNLAGRKMISIKGQDANSCLLRSPNTYGGYADLDTVTNNNSLSGFTLQNIQVGMSDGDVVHSCVFANPTVSLPAGIWARGGFVANCTFNMYTVPAADIVMTDSFLMVANSIFLSGSNPFRFTTDPADTLYLLANDFPYWYLPPEYPGAGNLNCMPSFYYMTLFPTISACTVDHGAPIGLPYLVLPDIGAFEFGLPYGTQPLTFLNGYWNDDIKAAYIFWTPNPYDSFLVREFWIYRSQSPSFPGLDGTTPYAELQASLGNYFFDPAVVPGVTYYYIVKTYSGDSQYGPVISAVSPTASVTVPLNQPPVAVNDTAQTPENTAVEIAVLANDGDPDGDNLSVFSATQGIHGVTFINPSGTITYVPAPYYWGGDTFSYTISDGKGNTASAIVNVTVTTVNYPPSAVDDTIATNEDSPVSIPVLANDGDPDGDPLTIVSVTQPSHGSAVINGNSLSYAPAPNYNGADSFTYTCRDPWGAVSSATVSIVVYSVNDPPSAGDDMAATAAFTSVTIPALANDTDVDNDALSLTSVGPAGNGTAAANADGTVTYTPADGFIGPDQFIYTVSDGRGGTDTATVTVNVRAQLMRVVAITMATTTNRNLTSAAATVKAVDESGSPLSGAAVDGQWSGLTADGDSGLTAADGAVTLKSDTVKNANGAFTFTVTAVSKPGFSLDAAGSILSASIIYPPVVPGGKLHVASITMSLVSGKNTSARAAVLVVDEVGAPVASAAVNGEWSGAVAGTAGGTTDGNGTAVIASPGLKNASGKTFTFTVNSISKAGWTYDAAANIETGDSIAAP